MKNVFAALIISVLLAPPTLSARSNRSDKPRKESFKLDVNSIHPTQATVGFYEVDLKVKRLSRIPENEMEKYLSKNPVSVVLGLNRQVYLVDQHHFVAALHKQGIKSVYYKVVGDLSKLPGKNQTPDEFWKHMREKKWVFLRKNGVTIEPKDLPFSISGLVDDPYRSLAAQVQKKNGFKKSDKPNSEYIWADYFRPLITKEQIAKSMEQATTVAITLAQRPEAMSLPGYQPPPKKPVAQPKQ